MNRYAVSLGIILMIAGLIFPVFPINLSIINQTSITNIKANCNSSCTFSATVTNNNSTDTSITVWWVVKNSISQTVFISSNTVTILQGQSMNVQSSPATLSSGTYTLYVFATNSQSVSVSPSSSITFSTGTFELDVPVLSSFTVSLSPQAQSTVNYNGMIGYIYQPNTQITIDVKAKSTDVLLSCIVIVNSQVAQIASSGQCPQTRSPTDPLALEQKLTWTINQNAQVLVYVAYNTNYINTYTITASVVGQGSVTPSSATINSNSPSATFTFTPSQGSFFASWKLVYISNVIAQGTSSSVTFTQQQLQNLLSPFGVNSASLQLTGSFSTNPQLTVTSAQGITTSISGTQTYTYGTVVTITASAQQGYCFTGWVVNGQPYSKSTTIKLNMTQSYTVYAGGGLCTQVNNNPPPSGLSISALTILGAVITVIGLVMKKET